MAPKRNKTSVCDGTKPKRRSIDLEQKIKIIKQREGGKSVGDIARDFDMSHTTVTTILKSKDKITEAAKGTAPMTLTRLDKKREGPISDMEKLLSVWIEDQTQKRIPLSTLVPYVPMLV